MKTTYGYKVPDECVLFDSAWERIIRQTDVLSLDVKFFKLDISMYKDQLRAMGVKIDSIEVCSVISLLLFSQARTSVIKRFYNFLSKFNWRPERLNEHNSWVWIPNHGGDEGKWVISELCVLHDTDDLFGCRLYSLYNYYGPELSTLFSSAFGVREVTSLREHLQVWNHWGSSTDHQVSPAKCLSFWECISKNWKPETEETLEQNLTKFSATTCLNDTIHLVNKELVFIPDNLRLRKIFSNVSVPWFAWFPKYGGTSSTLSQRLLDIYSSLGLKKVSESVKLKVGSAILTADRLKTPLPRNRLIEKCLIKIVLAFLACPRFDMAAKDRQEIAASLLYLSLCECDHPIKVT